MYSKWFSLKGNSIQIHIAWIQRINYLDKISTFLNESQIFLIQINTFSSQKNICLKQIFKNVYSNMVCLQANTYYIRTNDYVIGWRMLGSWTKFNGHKSTSCKFNWNKLIFQSQLCEISTKTYIFGSLKFSIEIQIHCVVDSNWHVFRPYQENIYLG